MCGKVGRTLGDKNPALHGTPISSPCKVLFWELWPQAKPVLFTDTAGSGWSYKAQGGEAYWMKSSIFKKQLPICLVKPHPYLHHSSRSQMLPFSTSKLSALDSFPDAQSLRFSSPHPAATKLTEGNTFVYAPSYPFSLSWFPAEILSRYQLSLSNS